jgi:acyl transferase domain-containing protein
MPTHIHGKPFSFSEVSLSSEFSTLTIGLVHLGEWLFHMLFASPNRYHRFLSAQKMTSSNSRCATFTNEADGYANNRFLNNVSLTLALDMFHRRVLLVSFSTRSAAIRDGDNILGVVRSTDVKHDGRSQGLVAPNVKAQIAMQIALLEKANLAPAEIE